MPGRPVAHGRVRAPRPSVLALALALAVLLAAVGLLPGSLVSAQGPEEPGLGVSPGTVTEEIAPGATHVLDKDVDTPVVPPRPEVVLLVDGTISMEPTIANVQQNLDEITDRVRAEQPDSRFAVATYGDAEVDGDRTFEVLQELTFDLAAVQAGVDALTADRGANSGGPAEDWINALWQIADGAGGATEFRERSSPVVVLVGDASSHDPSVGHTLQDAASALRSVGARVLAVDVETELGDGLNGDGTADWGTDEPHEPDQATRLIEVTGGTLFEGIDAEEVSDTVVEGLTNLPSTVGYQTLACDPALAVTLEPASQTVTSGQTATFTETVEVAEWAAEGTVLECTLQFLLDGQPPDAAGAEPGPGPSPGPGPGPGPGQEPSPDYRQTLHITVNDVTPPVVTVDDRTVEATSEDGARVEYTATARDAVAGPLPVDCDPASGSLFPVGTTEVTCTATDPAGNTGTDTATFTVLPYPPPEEPSEPPPSADVAVTATVEPGPGYPGQPVMARFTLTNAGPDPAEDVVLATAWPRHPGADGDAERTVGAQSGCTASAPCAIPAGGRTVVVQPAGYDAPIDGELRALAAGSDADPNHDNNRATARVRVVQPELTVTPEAAAPGEVAIARGVDFPPGRPVALSWDPGITPARSTVTVDADGTFEAQVLILRKDQLGPRVLRAEVSGVTPVEEDLLVVQRNLQPPDFAGRG